MTQNPLYPKHAMYPRRRKNETAPSFNGNWNSRDVGKLKGSRRRTNCLSFSRRSAKAVPIKERRDATRIFLRDPVTLRYRYFLVITRLTGTMGRDRVPGTQRNGELEKRWGNPRGNVGRLRPSETRTNTNGASILDNWLLVKHCRLL